MQSTITDFLGTPMSNQPVKITFKGPAVSQGKFVINEPRVFTNDATGSLILSNMAGGTYKYECTGPYTITTLQITIPETNGFLYASDFPSTGTNAPNGSSAYSISAADARFVTKTNAIVTDSINITNAHYTITANADGITIYNADTESYPLYIDNAGNVTFLGNLNLLGFGASLTQSQLAQIANIPAKLPITNGTAMFSLIIQTNSSSGVDGYNGSLILQPMRGITWGTNTATSIWYNEQHGGETELQFGCKGSFSFTEGQDQLRSAFCHFGGSGHYHGIYALQYDEDRISTNWNGLAETSSSYLTNNGYSHFLDFCGKYWDVSLGQAMTRHVGFRMDVADNTTTNIAFNFYSHIRGWNQLSTTQNESRDEIGGTIWIDEQWQGAALGFPRAYITNTFDRGVYPHGNQSSSVVIDLNTNDSKTVTLTGGTITFSTTNLNKIRLGGREVRMEILTSSTAVTNLTWPADWQWVGNKPTNFYADAVGLLCLSTFGNTDNNIVAQCPTNSRVYKFANSESTAYFAATGASISGAQKTSIDNFVTSAKSHGYASKLLFYPLFGDSGNGVANSKPLLGSTSMTWSNSPTHGASSVTFNGTSFGNLGVSPSTFFSSKDTGTLFVWCTTATPTDNGYFMGSTVPSSFYAGLFRSGNNLVVAGLNVFNTSGSISAAGNFNHFLAVNRTAAGSETAYVDTTASALSITSTGLNAQNIYIGGRNDNGTFGSGSAYTAIFAGVGNGMTAQNMTDLYNDLAQLKSDLGK